MNTNTRTIFTEYGTEFVEEAKFGSLTKYQREQAMEAIQAYNTPMGAPEIAKLVARLQIISPEKNKSEYDIKARTIIWVEELSKYPADVVNKVLKMRYRWFPSLAEVLENCDNEVAYRKLIERGIRVAKWK